jgi:hypothetical protein
MTMTNISKILNVAITVLAAFVLALAIKGASGNPQAENINSEYWVDNGPFESSNERGRFALTYSLIEDGSVNFSIPVADFATPDLAYKDGKYVSLFAPGVAFISAPGYLLGKSIDLSQVGAFATTSLIALLNALLIAKVAKKIGATELSSKIAGLIFLFGSPAFSYATTMYQHHISVFLILLSLYSYLNFKDVPNLLIVSFLYSLGIVVDYPNGLIMLPILISSLIKLIKKEVIDKKIIKFDFNYVKPLAAVAVIPPMLFFLWYNNLAYGSPLTISAVVPRAVSVEDGKPLFYSAALEEQITEDQLQQLEKKGSLGFFKTRRIINGLVVHIFSSDRGILYYTPVMILGIIGMIIKGRKKNISIFWAISSLTLILYSMWGDPWGGWTFGSRYLIPVYAVLSIFIPFVFERIRKNYFLIVFVLGLVTYSVAVNSLGALTSTANPPKIEAQEMSATLGREFKYTYERNIDLLLENRSRSFIYNTYLKEAIFVWEYYYVITVAIVLGLIASISYETLFQNTKVRRFGRGEK